jgi:hypothetical protein
MFTLCFHKKTDHLLFLLASYVICQAILWIIIDLKVLAEMRVINTLKTDPSLCYTGLIPQVWGGQRVLKNKGGIDHVPAYPLGNQIVKSQVQLSPHP